MKKRMKIRMHDAVAGSDFSFANGSTQFVDAEQAQNWALQGVCSIIPDGDLTADDRAACAHDGGEKQFTGPRQVP